MTNCWLTNGFNVGSGKPVVVCVVDWTGLLNNAHVQWRQALAEAAGTTIDRVTVHCVHQHNAPFACVDAEQIILEQGGICRILWNWTSSADVSTQAMLQFRRR